MKTNAEAVKYGSEGAVVLALRDHFNPKEYVVLPQVRNGAGFSATRTADALVMSTWPSRGLSLYGVEIKVSRGDWLRENKQPEKADEVAAYCDHWVVAVGDEAIVKDGELPTQWGLLVPGKQPGTLRMKQPPGKLEAKPMSRSFLARILRKTLEVAVPLGEVDSEIERRVAERVAELTETLTRTLTRDFDPAGLKKSNEDLLASVKAFKDATGVWIDAYDPSEFKRLAKVLNLMRWNDLGSWLDRFEKMADDHKAHIKVLRAALPSGQAEMETASE